MVFPPLHVDALIAWFVRLCASYIKLRRFGPGGKSNPGEYANHDFPSFRRKIDKYKHQPAALFEGLRCGFAQ
jgi:hypothetical protein